MSGAGPSYQEKGLVESQTQEEMKSTEKLPRELAEYIKDLMKSETHKLADRLDCVEQENSVLNEKINGLEQENGTLKERVNGLEQENGTLKERVNGLEKENGTLKEVINQQKERINGLEQENGTLKERVNGLEQENGTLKEVILQQNEAFRAKIYDVKHTLKEELEDIRTELYDVKLHNFMLNDRLEDQNHKVLHLEFDLEKIKQEKDDFALVGEYRISVREVISYVTSNLLQIFSPGNEQIGTKWAEIKKLCHGHSNYKQDFNRFLRRYAELLDFDAFSKLIEAKDELNQYFHRIRKDHLMVNLNLRKLKLSHI